MAGVDILLFNLIQMWQKHNTYTQIYRKIKDVRYFKTEKSWSLIYIKRFVHAPSGLGNLRFTSFILCHEAIHII